MVFTIKFSVLINLIQYLIILICLHIYKGYLPSSPYTDVLKVVVFTFKIFYQKFKMNSFYFLGFRKSPNFTRI